MGLILMFTIILIILIPLSFMWVKGMEEMNEKYPNYKGEDLFDENLKTNKNKNEKL